ncbi:Bifunctional uridylyltransferase/uridylyl-removing enzyme [Thalassocella blandensis]|nr:Bifunctional uridylyltransferase/uridylyl-removing enzyme [Thalassocella blandensis]
MLDFPEFACQPLCFKQEKFRKDLDTKPPIGVFKDAIKGIDTHLKQRFYEDEDIRFLVRERSAFIDLILHYAWHHDKTWGDDIALVAVGGYGRGELHPHSDIDILFLLGNKTGKKYNEQIQGLITFFWDIGLDIGSSVRTVKECTSFAKKDITIATNIMESRTIAGNTSLLNELTIATGPDKMWKVPDFFKAKWAEQTERHLRHNDTESNLEPNIKNAPGGLRDIQTINWVAKRYFGVRTLAQLEGKGFFTEHEFAVLRTGEEFLWQVRYGVHLLAGRADERLLFEHQRELAKIFGYKDTDKRLAVEQFMHRYYRTVMALRELNDVLLHFLAEAINREKTKSKIVPINDRFQLHDSYIEVTRASIFDEFPSALLEIFVLMGNDPRIKGVRASTIRLIRDKRWLVDKKFRQNPENQKMFLAIFSIDYGLVTQLTRMKRYGILGRYIPAFGKIIGQMQHDLFHRYTVDAHTLLVIQNMRRFTLPEEEKKYPVAAHVVNNLPNKDLLYIAGLFHDIAKGRGGDHSTLGAEDALEFCEAHGMSGRESRLVSWLVEKHLLMSYVSQKQDIDDPEVIHNFAIQVGDQVHLDYLYALTVADMCGTNPEIWNTWRASLLRQLYTETKRALRRGLENTIDVQDLIEEKQKLAIMKLADKGINESQALPMWDGMGDEYFVRESHLDIAWQTEEILKHPSEAPLVIIRETVNSLFKGATEIFIRVKDAQHVFVAVATCLTQQGLNIQDARIYSAANGYTVDTFYVLDENYQPLTNQHERHEKIAKALKDELSLIGEYSKIASRRTPRQLKQFPIPTRTRLSNDLTRGCTVLELISPDRQGLLATIATIFMRHNIQMLNAKISTLGERVEDIFFITDNEGNPLGDAQLCDDLQREICQVLDQRVEKELIN